LLGAETCRCPVVDEDIPKTPSYDAGEEGSLDDALLFSPGLRVVACGRTSAILACPEETCKPFDGFLCQEYALGMFPNAWSTINLVLEQQLFKVIFIQ